MLVFCVLLQNIHHLTRTFEERLTQVFVVLIVILSVIADWTLTGTVIANRTWTSVSASSCPPEIKGLRHKRVVNRKVVNVLEGKLIMQNIC
jgi:hypothetical protein